ncbi:MAG: MFS transporter [Rhodospirillaceae bacterium]|nr:MFS transporter [Rhodospirillaceae bacterium]
MDRTPKKIMEHGRMTTAQWTAVAVTVGLNALDGFDVLSISFASPGIASEWGLGEAVLGWVLSMELLGMAIGSLVLGPVADRYGRRFTILICLLAMTAGMFGAGFATGVPILLFWRLLTGLGIGGMLAAINAAAAEFSNGRWRGLAMALMVIGYPIGGILGGIVVQRILGVGTWHDVFFFGGWATAAFIPIVWFLVPESPLYYDRRRGPGALEKINRVLARLGHAPATELTPVDPTAAKPTMADIFKPGLVMTTVLVTAAYFTHIMSFYFLVKWVPAIVVDMGFAPTAAARLLTWVSAGGAVGGAIFGFFATRMQLRPLTIITLIGSALAIAWFGSGVSSMGLLTVIVAFAGFFTNASIAGLYMLFAKVYPTHARATGTGFAIGVGRGGAALAPIVAGYLFEAGFGLQSVALTMGSGAVVAAVLLFFLKERAAD